MCQSSVLALVLIQKNILSTRCLSCHIYLKHSLPYGFLFCTHLCHSFVCVSERINSPHCLTSLQQREHRISLPKPVGIFLCWKPTSKWMKQFSNRALDMGSNEPPKDTTLIIFLRGILTLSVNVFWQTIYYNYIFFSCINCITCNISFFVRREEDFADIIFSFHSSGSLWDSNKMRK